MPQPRKSPALRAVFVALGVWLAAYGVHFAVSVGILDALVGRFGHDAMLLVLVGLCAARAARHRSERVAWWLIAAAMLSWTLGEIYYTTVLHGARSVPVPSPADIGYLGVYPLAFAGLMLLMRERTGHVSPTIWVDGVIAALVVGALACAVVFEAVLHTVGGRPISIATNLAYPLGDMLLLLVVVTAYALRGWRPDRSSMFLGAGIMCFWAADSIYLVATAQSSTYTESGPLNLIAWTGFILVALAAWQPSRTARARQDLGSITVPICFALVGLALLVYATVDHVNVLAVALAGSALVGVIVRLVITFRANVAMLARSRRDAMSDALTSLGNRRQLMSDLEHRFACAGERDPFYLVLFDLDGFKLYNDHFGHPAGTPCSPVSATTSRTPSRHTETRTGSAATSSVRSSMFAKEDSKSVVGAACAALSETGDGFAVRTSCGAVRVPSEATSASDALRIADNRLYQDKEERRGPTDHTHSVLLQAVRERHPDLHQHLEEVAALSRAVALQMGLGARDLDQVVRAAEMHDVGKIAIPDTVLDKPGPLNEREWELMERHTVLGERILAAAPALRPIAEIVRASHERYDGTGYPDGTAGTARTPAAARPKKCNSRGYRVGSSTASNDQ